MRDLHLRLLLDLARIREMLARDRAAALAAIQHMKDCHNGNVEQCRDLHGRNHEPIRGHIDRIRGRGPFRGR